VCIIYLFCFVGDPQNLIVYFIEENQITCRVIGNTKIILMCIKRTVFTNKGTHKRQEAIPTQGLHMINRYKIIIISIGIIKYRTPPPTSKTEQVRQEIDTSVQVKMPRIT
jgi:hypothetical protein